MNGTTIAGVLDRGGRLSQEDDFKERVCLVVFALRELDEGSGTRRPLSQSWSRVRAESVPVQYTTTNHLSMHWYNSSPSFEGWCVLCCQDRLEALEPARYQQRPASPDTCISTNHVQSQWSAEPHEERTVMNSVATRSMGVREK